MMWKKYKYWDQWTGDEITYRPMIGLKVFNNKCVIETTAIIDSGCDRIMLNAELAEALGIHKDKCRKRKVTGIIDQGVESFIAKVKVEIEGFNDLFEVSVTFVPGLRISGLLGQNDFFDIFKVKFEKRQKTFELSKEE
jgi:hypothetical protein